MRLKAPEQTEAQFEQAVTQLAELHGWRVYHTRNSKGSVAGFPDLVMVKPGQPVIFAELKRESGKVTKAQADWNNVLHLSSSNITVRLWRPSHWPHIEDALCQPSVSR